MPQRGDPDEAESGLASRAAVETTGARILRGSLWAGASSVIPLVYVLVVSIAAARGLVAFAWRLQLGAALVGGASSPPQESPAPTLWPHGCSPASAPRSACSTRCRAPS